MNPLSLPIWALDAFITLGIAIGRLLSASNDDEREAALMVAAEGLKAALDKKKFG